MRSYRYHFSSPPSLVPRLSPSPVAVRESLGTRLLPPSSLPSTHILPLHSLLTFTPYELGGGSCWIREPSSYHGIFLLSPLPHSFPSFIVQLIIAMSYCLNTYIVYIYIYIRYVNLINITKTKFVYA